MSSDGLAGLAAAILGLRGQRSAFFGHELFGGEQCWDLPLILFVADARGDRLSGRDAVERGGGSIEVGRRWIVVLTRMRLIVGDGDGNLDDVLTITPQGLELMETWLRQAKSELRQDSRDVAN